MFELRGFLNHNYNVKYTLYNNFDVVANSLDRCWVLKLAVYEHRPTRDTFYGFINNLGQCTGLKFCGKTNLYVFWGGM